MSEAAARGHLRQAAGCQSAALQRALRHSRTRVEAAALMEELLGVPLPQTGSAYLQYRRRLREIEGALLRAEAGRLSGERQAQAGLREAAQLLGEVAPELVEPLLRLCLDLPLDPGMGERLPALVALLRVRQGAVPLLIGARPTWKR